MVSENIIEIALGEITPYEGSHQSDETVALLVESINKYGITQPIIVDKNRVIVAGNAVYKAAELVGLQTIPCIVADNLTEEEVNEYRIADNKTGEFAKWNETKLRKELSILSRPEDIQFAFDTSLQSMLQRDAVAPPVITPQQKPQEATQNGVEAPQGAHKAEEPDVHQRENEFKEKVKKQEMNNVAQSAEYFEYTCSKCGRVVRVRTTQIHK